MSIVLERSDVAAFGAFLRTARERRGLTIQQIASETRIPRRHLDALEHGDLDALPSGMYRRAEVRAYADAVGLDRGLALAHLEQVLDGSETTTASARPDPAVEPRERNLTAYAALALIALVTLWAVTRAQWQTAPQVIDPVSAATPAGAPMAGAPAAPPVETAPDGISLDAAAGAPVEPQPPALPVPAAAMATDAPADVAAPAAAVDFALVVTSAPDGARVLVDGIGWGQTPITIRHVTPGDRRLRVVRDGYVSHEQRVRIGGSRARTAVHVDLKPAS